MKWFLNMKIAAKLILGFLIVAIIAGVVGGIGLINLNKMASADRQLYEINVLVFSIQVRQQNISKGSDLMQ